MTIYNRTLAGFSRRELMKICWTLGAAAIAQPLLGRRLLAKPIFESYPFSLGVASGDPLPDGIVLWTSLAPKPLEGDGMPMHVVEWTGRSRAMPGFRTSSSTEPRAPINRAATDRVPTAPLGSRRPRR